MARKIHIGVDDTAKQARKIYVGVDGIARRVKKIYIGVENLARLCYAAFVRVFYQSDLSLSFTEKEVDAGTAYGSFPTLPTDSNRVDFWFHPDTIALNDPGKKYIDYPWCAYSDQYPDLYKQMGYREDYLAEHWDKYGVSEGRTLGTLTANDICTKTDDHTLYHRYAPKSIILSGVADTITGIATFWEVFGSDGTSLGSMAGTTDTKSMKVYPGMQIYFYARHDDGWANVGSDGSACFVKIDGVTVGQRGTYVYTVPKDVQNIHAVLNVDNHWDNGLSYQITVTTTKF